MQPGVSVLNGAGELTGSLEVAEWGWLASPVYLTATMSVGRVYDGAVEAAVARDPRIGVDDVTIPVVGECDDSWLNDARVRAGRGRRHGAGARRRLGGVLAGCRGRGHRHDLLRLEGRNRLVEPPHRGRSCGRCAGARQLRRGAPSCIDGAGGPAAGGGRAWAAAGGRRPARSWRELHRGRGRRPSGLAAARRRRRAGLGLARTGSVAHNEARDLPGLLDHGARRARRAAARVGDQHRPQPDHRDGRRSRGGGAERPSGRPGDDKGPRRPRGRGRLPHEPVLEQSVRHGRLAG